MNSERGLLFVILLPVLLAPGLLAFEYSTRFVTCGLGPVDSSWDSGDIASFSVNLTSADPLAVIVVQGQGLRISHIDTEEKVISVVVSSEVGGILLNLANVTGDEMGSIPTMPTEEPLASLPFQNFSVFLHWEGENTTVTVYYNSMTVSHADAPVCLPLAGFEEAQTVGLVLIGAGLVSWVICVLAYQKRLTTSMATSC
ncbi:MAG: hypothetical protein C4K49_02515 [Candidatus Thorarchaeota archaeon]|nr:MAG: hypothetical protein C4K49_02515 [Candidatus Thorarchaeota archaeon]